MKTNNSTISKEYSVRAKQIWDISNGPGWDNFQAMRNNLVLAGQKPRAQFCGEKRTLDQNALSFALYTQIGNQIQDQSISDIRAECKLTVGVPLLRAKDEAFCAFYNAGLLNLTYEQKIAAMEYVPVTSIMGKKVFSQYIDDVIRKYSKQGISIVMPGEDDYG